MKDVYKPVLLLSATLPGIYASENIPIASTTASDRSSPAMQYMQQLYRSLADENGNPKSASVSVCLDFHCGALWTKVSSVFIAIYGSGS